MTILYSRIVGSHFHPPASYLLSLLPANTPLILSPEPDNLYDSNAILVLLDLLHLNFALLDDDRLVSCGTSIKDLKERAREGILLHLGYLPASAKTADGFARNTEVLPLITQPDHTSVLSFSPDGKYLTKIEVPQKADDDLTEIIDIINNPILKYGASPLKYRRTNQ